MERGSSFEALRRLATCFEKLDARAARKQVTRLGAVAVPMLLRELTGERGDRRDLSAQLFAALVAEHPALRTRALREVRAIAQRSDGALKALSASLTAALGGSPPVAPHGASAPSTGPGASSAAASFLGAAGPSAPDAHEEEEAQRQNALALAAELNSPADVAAAADLMTKQLDGAEMVSLLEMMSATSPDAATQLLRELAGRVDLENGVRSELRALAAAGRVEAAGAEPPLEPPRSPRSPRAGRTGLASTLLLEDDRGAQVIVAVRRRGAQRRWRRFAMLIGADGAVEDCLYEDDVPAAELGDPLSAPLISGLVSEGFRLVADGSEGARRARGLAAEAARRAAAIPHRLTSAYFLGRDILELGDVHLGTRSAHGELASAIGRAVDLLAAGEVLRAKEVAARCARVAPDDPDVASTLGQCHLAAGELTAAAEWLARAAAAEPSWPTHHWNLAAVHHRAEHAEACAEALAAFLLAVERRGDDAVDRAPLDRDLDQRVAMARRYVAANRPAPAAEPPAEPSAADGEAKGASATPKAAAPRRGFAKRAKPARSSEARED